MGEVREQNARRLLWGLAIPGWLLLVVAGIPEGYWWPAVRLLAAIVLLIGSFKRA